MRSRTLPIAGLSAAALIAGAAAAPMATASIPTGDSGRHVPAAISMSGHSAAATPAIPRLKGKCHTLLGTWTEDGIISWNSPPNGFDAAGAADFNCTKTPAKRRTFSTVTVLGIFGDPVTTQFNVTVYSDLNGEPNNNAAPVCATQTAPGTPTGDFPDVTVITLNTPCKGLKGVNWIEVQAQSDDNSWYWGTQTEVGGKNPADWRDANGSFGTPCTPGYQDGFTMQDCIFGGDAGEPDFMFMIE